VAGDRLGLAAEETRYFVQILAAASFVFAQPILDVFGASPETFLGASASRNDMILFALIWVLVPAGVIWFACALTRLLGRRVRSLVHSAAIGALAGVFCVEVLVRNSELSGQVIVVVAAVVATLAAVAQRRLAAMGMFLTYAVIAPLIFLGLFFLSSPSGELVRTDDIKIASSTGGGAPILFVVFDELPTELLLDGDRNIDAALFPNLAAFADDSTWYRNNTTNATTTRVAVPTIMTGKFPTEDRVPTSQSYPESIFTLLGGSYEMHVQEPITAVCPPNLCVRGEGGGLRALLRRSREIWFQRLEREGEQQQIQDPFRIDDGILNASRLDLTRQFTTGVAAAPGPRLDFAHVLLPHQQWELLPSDKSYDVEMDGLIFLHWHDADAGAVARVRSLLQLQLADKLLGEMLGKLRALGTYDDALVVVTADHGVSFQGETPVRAMTEENRHDIAFAPLLIKAPRQTEGRIDERNAQAIDVVPTIADLLDLEVPWELDGVSLAGPDQRPGSEKRILLHDYDEIDPGPDGTITLDASELYPKVLAGAPVAPGDPADPLRVYRFGVHGGLLGRAVDDIGVGDAAGPGGTIHGADREYDPAGASAPVYVRARVDTTAPLPVALAVNGRVAAWSHTHEAFGDPNVWFMIPEPLLRPGRNELRMYLIEGDGDATVLRPIS
jgi:hypothetical protein